MRRLIAIVAPALLATALLPAGAAAHARPRRRALCARFRCTTVTEDRLVRVITVHYREAETETESTAWLHYAVWKPSRRAWPLGDFAVQLDSDRDAEITVAGPWVAYVEDSCSHETEECGFAVQRLNAQTDRHEEVSSGIPNERAPLPPLGEGCLAGGDTHRPGIGPLLAVESGTIAWTQFDHVCELPHDVQTPALLASDPGVVPGSLELADGYFIWRDGESLGSAPAR